MMKTIALLALLLLVTPQLASAESTYYAGGERVDAVGKQGLSGRFDPKKTLTLVELIVSPEKDKITERILQPNPSDPNTLYVSGSAIAKQANGTWGFVHPKSKKLVPATVELQGSTVKSITREFPLGKAKLAIRTDLSNPVVFRSEATFFTGTGVKSFLTTIDAGLITQNQFETLTKGKKTAPKPVQQQKPKAAAPAGPKK